MSGRTLFALAAAALIVTAGALAATAPRLRVVDDAPLTVRGTGFRAHEAIRVTVAINATRLSRRTTASAVGAFTVRFPGTTLDRCATPLAISARGARSGSIEAILAPRDCAMP